MSNGTSTAVTEATRLGEIGFPEFTAKLITDTFNAIVASNLRQMEAFSELLSATSLTLSQYATANANTVSQQEVWDWLTKNLPGPAAAVTTPTQADATLVHVGVTLSSAEATKISTLTGVNPSQGELTQMECDSISTSVRTIVAGERWTMLKEMVKMGLLRLVVDSGKIETRLTFTTFGRSESVNAASSVKASSFQIAGQAQTGSALSPWVKAKVSCNYSTASVRTTSSLDREVSGSTVQIYGSVVIQFKTDYQPLG